MLATLTAKTKSKLKYAHFKTYRGLKTAVHRLKLFLYDPRDLAPGDCFPCGPLVFQMPKRK
jgi:hypothetical protein